MLRAVRDADEAGIKRVVIANRAALARARNFATRTFGGGGPIIDGHKTGQDLFEDAGISAQLEALMQARVSLAGGGAITIETTEAMTTVDVDTAGISGSDKDANAFAVNLAAATETARQVRLRGIGGLVVIDFVRLDDPAHRKQVVAALQSTLSEDRATTRIGRMDDFSLVAFTRRREGPSLTAALLERCRVCDGQGWRLSLSSAAAAAYKQAGMAAQSGAPGALVISVPPDVAATMNQGDANVAAFATRVGREIRVVSDPARERAAVEVHIADANEDTS